MGWFLTQMPGDLIGTFLVKTWKYGPGGSLETKQNPWRIQVNPWVSPGENLGNQLDCSILGKARETADGVKQIAPLERSLFFTS